MQPELSKPELSKPENRPIIYVEFSDGYSIRNLIEYLKSTNVHGNFVFTEDGISYSQPDADNTILNEISIPRCNLPMYIYNSTEPYLAIGVTISNLRKITKSIGKKDTVQMYILPNNPMLCIRIISVNTKALNRGNMNYLKPQSLDLVFYDLKDAYSRSDDNPNCSIPIMDFCRMCAAMYSIQCSYVTVRGFPRGAIFEGMIEGGITGRIDKFGICEPLKDKSPSQDPISSPDFSSLSSLLDNISLDKIKLPSTNKIPKLVVQSSEEEVRIRISMSTIKALSKINNLSTSSGIVKLYMEPDRPLKLVCNIGMYGKLTIYLRDPK